MRVRIFAMVGIFIISLHAQAKVNFTFDPGYLYSRVDHHSSTSSFSLLNQAGSRMRGQMITGWKKFDFAFAGQYDQHKFEVSELRNVQGLAASTAAWSSAVRFNNRYFTLSYIFEKRDLLYLAERSTTNFNIEKVSAPFSILGLKLFAWGASYRMSFDAEYGVPVAPVTTEYGDLDYSYFARGTLRLEFGNNFRLGLFVGGGYEDYSIGSYGYNRLDFVGGITIYFGTRPVRDKGDLSTDQLPTSARPGWTGPSSYPNY